MRLPSGPDGAEVVDRLWTLTQDPVQHARWDLRFSSIAPVALATGAPAQPDDAGTGAGPATTQRFTYLLELPHPRLPLLRVSGEGASTSARRDASGRGTSALRWTVAGALSPLGPGAGWWRYVPQHGRVLFRTGYDYAPGWGRVGPLLDPWLVRPLVGWATAWSFDRLRLWVERDLDPAVARDRSLALLLARVVLTLGGAGAALRGRPLLGVAVALLALAAPPPAAVPAARRCRRRPRGRHEPPSSPARPEVP
ncbi:hypothetical protein [Pseudokineococcus sp. 1T1Z-3]|uniref:hypothetical protein n=1 Tax=Pseudokineococcus sp. 1T1Z-3 TaxID=3132745 RepID=UPI0030A0F710